MILFIETAAAGVVFLEVPAFTLFRRMRGLMCLKIVMIRMLMGNMKRPLSMATMNSCHVSSKEPAIPKKYFVYIYKSS